jgi:hypothetical protein
LATSAVIQNLEIGLLPYLVSTGACWERNAEIHAVRVEGAARAASARQSQTVDTVLMPRAGWGITQALHGKSCALIHVPAQIDKQPVGIAYLDKSKTRILEIDDHIRSHRQDDGETY